MDHRKRKLSWQTLCLSFASTEIWVLAQVMPFPSALFSSRFYCLLDELTIVKKCINNFFLKGVFKGGGGTKCAPHTKMLLYAPDCNFLYKSLVLH